MLTFSEKCNTMQFTLYNLCLFCFILKKSLKILMNEIHKPSGWNCLTTVAYLDMTVSVDTAKSNSGTNDFTGN